MFAFVNRPILPDYRPVRSALSGTDGADVVSHDSWTARYVDAENWKTIGHIHIIVAYGGLYKMAEGSRTEPHTTG